MFDNNKSHRSVANLPLNGSMSVDWAAELSLLVAATSNLTNSKQLLVEAVWWYGLESLMRKDENQSIQICC